jgi:hypothetical protein
MPTRHPEFGSSGTTSNGTWKGWSLDLVTVDITPDRHFTMAPASPSSTTQEYTQLMRELGLIGASNGINDAGSNVIQVRVEHVFSDGRSWMTLGVALGRHVVQSLRIVSFGVTFAMVSWGVAKVIYSLRDRPVSGKKD